MDGLIAILCAIGLPIVFLVMLLYSMDGRRVSGAPRPPVLTREEEERDAIAGEMWRQGE